MPAGSAEALWSAVDQSILSSGDLFERIGTATRDAVSGAGIRRDSYGAGETLAAGLLKEAAQRLDLETREDWAGNLYFTYRGVDPGLPEVLVGSHIDSVPSGGNYDGLAGIIAGLACVSALKQLGHRPLTSLTVMAIRGEENAWFGAQHIGSRMALGSFDPEALTQAKRIDTGRSLEEHMTDAGFDPAPVRARTRLLTPQNVKAFVELHIEQGPVLEQRALPVGIVTGIRGNVRATNCRCSGSYDHSGTVPRGLRHDAVMAVSELVMEMDRFWTDCETQQKDLVLTFGKFATDPKKHSVTTIPGEVGFTVDARSHSDAVLSQTRDQLLAAARRIGETRGVTFDLGRFSGSPAVAMDSGLRQALLQAAMDLDLAHMELPSGAGHDAADFGDAGIPSAMIFVRNANGSHNPDEQMRMDDFRDGTRLLLELLCRILNEGPGSQLT